MIRIAWVNIPENKKILISLTYIVWIWNTTSWNILDKLKIEHTKKTKDLTEKDLDLIRKEIDLIDTEVEVRRAVQLDIQMLQQIWTYRWFRHRAWLPCRGQLTKTNARTSRRKAWRKRTTIAWKKI